MAKKQKKQVQNKGKARKSQRQRQHGISRQQQYAQLLVAPDNGTLPNDGVYDGELGNFRRFVQTFSLGAPTHTSGVLAFCPATGNGIALSTAAPTDTITHVLTNVGFPGLTYLSANASKSRGIAAKIDLMPSTASFSNLTGEACAGVTTFATFPTGAYTVNSVFDSAKAYAPLQRKAVTSRWFPSGLDHTYSAYNVSPSEDHNVVFVAFRGWPVGLLMNIRVTYVVEYTVKPSLGIPPSGSVSQPVGHHAVVASLQTSDPHWHHSLLDEVKEAGRGIVHDAGLFARGMARMGLTHLGSNLLKQAPKALPLLLA